MTAFCHKFNKSLLLFILVCVCVCFGFSFYGNYSNLFSCRKRFSFFRTFFSFIAQLPRIEQLRCWEEMCWARQINFKNFPRNKSFYCGFLLLSYYSSVALVFCVVYYVSFKKLWTSLKASAILILLEINVSKNYKHVTVGERKSNP